MKYRVECLTPVLAGDGNALSPIDYMVWKDQINVLDQRRIFRLLAKGPRLDGYLNQVRRADKLDFASWGGFAQNFAGRRIPFEHSSSTAFWNRLHAEHCHVPTFARNHNGAFLPGSALRGALRTALVAANMDAATLAYVQSLFSSDRPPRRPGESAEQKAIGSDSGRPGLDPMKALAISDSANVSPEIFKIYLLRTATLVESKSGGARYALGWKQSPRGAVEPRRVDDSTPAFAEMAAPGAVFEGAWMQRPQWDRPETARQLRWRAPLSLPALFEAANAYASRCLEEHRKFAEITGLDGLASALDRLAAVLAQIRSSGAACLLSIGWGGGLLGKTALPDIGEDYRRILALQPYYARAIRSGMPFPKTRRVVFLENRPATLPGWVKLEVT